MLPPACSTQMASSQLMPSIQAKPQGWLFMIKGEVTMWQSDHSKRGNCENAYSCLQQTDGIIPAPSKSPEDLAKIKKKYLKVNS